MYVLMLKVFPIKMNEMTGHRPRLVWVCAFLPAQQTKDSSHRRTRTSASLRIPHRDLWRRTVLVQLRVVASRTFTHFGTRIHNGGQLPDEMFLPLLCCRCKYSAMPRRGLTSSQAVVYPRMYTIVKGTLFYIGSSTKEFSASCTFATISCCCRQCSMQRRLLRSVRASARCVSAAWSE